MKHAYIILASLLIFRETNISEGQELPFPTEAPQISPSSQSVLNVLVHLPTSSVPVSKIEKQFIELNDLPQERRVKIRRDAEVEEYLVGLENASSVSFSSPVPPDTEVQLEKPWLAKPRGGVPKSALGYCPMRVSFGLRQIRQEERPNLPWPYEHTEVTRDGDIESEMTSIRNLGNFYALIDPQSGKFGTYERSARMPWRDDIQQKEIDTLCKSALESWSKTEVWAFGEDENGAGTALQTWIDGPAFLDHQPVDVKTACPGGGRDTFAATYGIFFELEKRELRIRDRTPEGAPGRVISSLICKARTQICCFDSESPWPLHSFYPGESGKGYDNPDPQVSPSAEQLEKFGRINYAYSFLGSKGIARSLLAPEDLALPSFSGLKDPWIKRISPVAQPPREELPTLERVIVKQFDLRLEIPLPQRNLLDK